MVTKKPKGLGLGLEALLGPKVSDAPKLAGDALPTALKLTQLQPGKYQPRTRMDEGSLYELAESIKAQGVMQPILVRPVSPGRYEIIAGERRTRAASLAGLDEVPVLVKDVPDEAAAAMSLIENIQREDLNPIEEAIAYRRLADEFQLKQEDIASAVGKDRTSVANHMRLLKLPDEVRAEVAAGTLSMGHARALLALPTDAEQRRLARDIITRNLSVRETESMVKHLGTADAPPLGPAPPKSVDVHTRAAEERLRLTLGTRVRIVRHGTRGRIEIDFISEDELIRIYEQLTNRD